MLLICEQCERGIEIKPHASTVSCGCGATYRVNTDALTYDRIIGHSIYTDIDVELKRANSIHPTMFNSSNEAAGVIREEYLEAEHELFHGNPNRARAELIQLAAMAVKAVQYIDMKTGGQR